MRKVQLLMCVVLVGAVAASASAVVREDIFYAIVEPGNTVSAVPGFGTGYADTFFEYPQGSDPSWWNLWFYSDPPDPTRWKEVVYDIHVVPIASGVPNYIEIALNWSTMAFPESGEIGPPPLPPLDVPYLERYVIFADTFSGAFTLSNLGDTFIIPDFNPEWMSIDVRADPDLLLNPNQVHVAGTIWHESVVPEPATMSLLALGGLALLRRRSR